MSKNQNQHYIPRLLLKRFLTPTPKGLHLFRFRRGDTESQEVGLKQAGAARLFYRDDIDPRQPDVLDDVLFNTESRIGPILTEICQLHHLPIRESEQYARLIRFIHDLLLRTPSVRAQLMQTGLKEIADQMSTPWIPGNSELVEKLLAKLEAGPPEHRYVAELFQWRTGTMTSLSEQSQKVLHRDLASYDHEPVSLQLHQRFWRILLAPPSGPFFIVSDEPVVVHDQNGRVRTGLKFPASRVTIPIAPTIALQGCYSSISRDILKVDALAVRKLNGVFARIAYREIFSSQPDFEWQHQAGTIFTSREWLSTISEATWPSNPRWDAT